ncbi:hypothetical protein GGX14DRAFT_571186 [Mycena pura]|uniref:RNase H type-1 domain-containing protein n=1 Tax=Mycena pura TaxID=153505 RepID=A0AAD6VB05_9AGAR|nr:hypothetical protein GGX14DRAFT_571186 [Mycena pura]
MPSGHVPAHAMQYPELFGALDCRIEVPQQAVDMLCEELTREEGPVSQFQAWPGLTAEFDKWASAAYEEIGAPSLTMAKAWDRWQDEGFHTIENGDLIELTVAKIRERKAPAKLIWVKGHSGVAGNEGADKLAGEGSRKPVEDDINVEAFASLIIPGAKLKAMTQAKAYKVIRKLTMKKPTQSRGSLEYHRAYFDSIQTHYPGVENRQTNR